MAGKGSYNEAQKKFVRDEVEEARAVGREPNTLAIAVNYNKHFEPKREPHEIAALVLLLFPKPGGKRRGRPPKVASAPQDKTRKRHETPKTIAKKGRVLTEKLEEAIVMLSGECVEVSRRINVGRLEGKLIEGFPDLKGRLGYNLLRGVLRRYGAIEAVARGDRPEMAAKMPEDLLGRIKVERCRIARELNAVGEEQKRLHLRGKSLLGRYDLLQGYEQGLEALEAAGEAASDLAVTLASNPGSDSPVPSHPLEDTGPADPGGHS